MGGRRLLRAVLALALVAAGSASARPAGALDVVATLPELGGIVAEIGGARVSVRTLTRGTENMHSVRARPSDLVAIKRADALVRVGLWLEAAWLSPLVMKARNPVLQGDAPGSIVVSEGWEPMQVPAELSRRQGDVHPRGNPHMTLDPRAGAHIADRVLEGLARLDPEGREEFERRHAALVARMDEAAERWTELRERLAGRKVVVYHQEFDYLLEYLGVVTVGTVEPRPGIPPSPGQVTELVNRMRSEEVSVILTAAWSNNRTVRGIADRTDAVVLELPAYTGGAPWATDWIATLDGIVTRLADALGASAPEVGGPEEEAREDRRAAQR
jgi:zinc/manganese transport system substrate-binding protein